MDSEKLYEILIKYINNDLYGIVCIRKYGMINMNIQIATSIVFGIACRLCDINAITLLISISIQKKCVINIHHDDEYAFRMLCRTGNTELLKCFIKYCDYINSIIDVHARQEEGIINACVNCDIVFIEHIIEYIERTRQQFSRYSLNNIIFVNICELYNNTDLIKFFINYGITIGEKIDVHINDELVSRSACRKENIELFEYIIKYCDEMKETINIHINDEEMFIIAVNNNCSEIIKLLFEYANKHNSKINIHAQNDKALIESCRNKDYEFMKYLINEGDIIGQKFDIHMDDEELFCCVCNCANYEMAKYLIEYGELHNSKINIHAQHEFVFIVMCDVDEETEKIQQYIKYLSKHNYNDKFNIEYPTKICNKINYKKIFIVKNIKIIPIRCNHSVNYKYFLNNNIVCSRCKYEVIESENVQEYIPTRNEKCFENTIFDINYSFDTLHIIDNNSDDNSEVNENTDDDYESDMLWY